MKTQPEISFYMSDELLKKFLYIAEAEGRTPNNQFQFMLRNNIQYFERTKGKIQKSELDKIDISKYIKDTENE